MNKMMHLNGFVMHSPMNHSVGSWLHPDSRVAESFAQPEIWQDMARTLERGKFDAIFFADTLAAFGNYRNRMDESAHPRHPVSHARSDLGDSHDGCCDEEARLRGDTFPDLLPALHGGA